MVPRAVSFVTGLTCWRRRDDPSPTGTLSKTPTIPSLTRRKKKNPKNDSRPFVSVCVCVALNFDIFSENQQIIKENMNVRITFSLNYYKYIFSSGIPKYYYSLTSLIRTTRELRESCTDYVFRLSDNPEFPRQNVKDTICPD